ncbi:uncharacterized protein LOC111244494 isoform X2 [Varroa destructor]|uniref:Uncharacterized protein n=1 Tax=Varroa destructor TaxID=109461 RepID=A0A7M7JK29_VARDE|nr:uncharacterized protein LOC111244494 isoform X2 [Varroa destructor]
MEINTAKAALVRGVLLKKLAFPNVTCSYSTSGEANYQEVFGDLSLVLLYHPLTADCVYPSSQDGPGRRLRIEIQPQDLPDSNLDVSSSSASDAGLLGIPLGRLVGLTSVTPQHTLRIAHSQCIYDDYRVKFFYIRLPTESDLEEFRIALEEMVKLRDCQEERLEPQFQNIIEESRRETRKQLRTTKARESRRRSRIDQTVDASDPLMLPPPFQDDETEVKSEEKLLLAASLFRFQVSQHAHSYHSCSATSTSGDYDSPEQVLGPTATLMVDSANLQTDYSGATADSVGGASSASLIPVPVVATPIAVPIPPPPIAKATTNLSVELGPTELSGDNPEAQRQLEQRTAPTPTFPPSAGAGISFSSSKTPSAVSQKTRAQPSSSATLTEEQGSRPSLSRPRGHWKKIAANVSVRVFPFAGRAMITVINDSLGHYIYATWVHSRMTCTQLNNSGYPDLFFPAPIRSSYKSESCDEAGEWALIGLRFTTAKDAQLFIDHINRHRSRLLLRETVYKMELPSTPR